MYISKNILDQQTKNRFQLRTHCNHHSKQKAKPLRNQFHVPNLPLQPPPSHSEIYLKSEMIIISNHLDNLLHQKKSSPTNNNKKYSFAQ